MVGLPQPGKTRTDFQLYGDNAALEHDFFSLLSVFASVYDSDEGSTARSIETRRWWDCRNLGRPEQISNCMETTLRWNMTSSPCSRFLHPCMIATRGPPRARSKHGDGGTAATWEDQNRFPTVWRQRCVGT